MIGKIWKTLFPTKMYTVYVGRYRVYHGKSRRASLKCYNQQCSSVRRWKNGGTVVLILKTKSTDNTTVVLKRFKRSSDENVAINRNIPFTSRS